MRRFFVPREPSRAERFASLAVAAGVAVVGAGVAYYLTKTLVARDALTSGPPHTEGEAGETSRALPPGEDSGRG